MNLDYPLTIKAAASQDFIDHVAALTSRHMAEFTPNSFDPERRKWLRCDSDVVLAAKKRDLAARIGIPDWAPEPEFGDYIGLISQGGSIHAHRDNAPGDKIHIRINLLVCKPEAGGIPLLDGHPLGINASDAWVCFASHRRHAATPVVGKTPRSVVSYGFLVDHLAALPLYAKYLEWISAVSREGAPA